MQTNGPSLAHWRSDAFGILHKMYTAKSNMYVGKWFRIYRTNRQTSSHQKNVFSQFRPRSTHSNVLCYNYIVENHQSTHIYWNACTHFLDSVEQLHHSRYPARLKHSIDRTLFDIANYKCRSPKLLLSIFSGTVSLRQMYQETCCKCFTKFVIKKPPPAFTVFPMKWGLAYLTSPTAITYQRKSSTYLRKAYFVFSKNVNEKKSHKIYQPLEKPFE